MTVLCFRGLFSERFLNCDYVGAFWPHHQEFCVGNGGFSLRSRKLICSLPEFLHPDDLNKAEDGDLPLLTSAP